MSGFLQPEEYNPDLRGHAALATFDRMRRSDASVREALQHIWAPIKNATWEIEPASDDPLDLEIAAFIERSFFDWPTHTFHEFLHQALLYLIFGHSVFEQVDQVLEDEVTFDLPDQETPQVVHRQWRTLHHLGQRLPRTIWKWNADNGVLQSITQQVFRNSQFELIEIPAERLIVFTNEKEADDFTGTSLLRSAYKAWVQKELIEKISTASAERHGMGHFYAGVPASMREDADALARLEQMLQGARAGEFNYFVFPGPVNVSGASGNESYSFGIESPKGGIPDFSKLLEYHRGEIKGNVVARFAELGHGATGSRAVGSVQSEVWYDALHAIARQIADTCAIVIRRLVDANYSVDDYPKLVAYDIESRNLAEFADVQFRLVSAGAVIPDRPYRDYVRKSIDAPEEAEDTEAKQQLQPYQPEVGHPAPPPPTDAAAETPGTPPDSR